jgi:hypothetical protein
VSAAEDRSEAAAEPTSERPGNTRAPLAAAGPVMCCWVVPWGEPVCPAAETQGRLRGCRGLGGICCRGARLRPRRPHRGRSEEPQPNCDATAIPFRSDPACTIDFGMRPQGNLAACHFDRCRRVRSVRRAPLRSVTSISFEDPAWDDRRGRSITSTVCAILYYYIKFQLVKERPQVGGGVRVE